MAKEGPGFLDDVQDRLDEFFTSEEDFELRIIVAASMGLFLLLLISVLTTCCIRSRAAKRRNEQEDIQHDSTEESVEKYVIKRGPSKAKEKASHLRYKKSQ